MARGGWIIGLVVLSGTTAAAADDGKEMYGKKCLPCHALDGSGDKPFGRKLNVPDLRHVASTQEEVEEVIAKGRGRMPAYGDRLSPEQIAEIAAYVRNGLR